jgi:hypothetical protein
MKYTSLVSTLFSLLITAGGFNAHSSSILKQFSSPTSIGGIVSDGSNLWIATSGGAVKYTLASGSKKVYSDLSDLPDLNLVAVVRDGAGDVWYGSAEGYLIRFHPATETFTTFNALASTGWTITCMQFFKDNIFIGSANGLSIFSIPKASVQNVGLFGTFTSTDVSALRSYGDTIALVTSDGIAYCVIGNMQTTILSDPSLWTCVPAAGSLGIIRANDSLEGSNFKILEIGSTVWQYGTSGSLLRNGVQVASFPSSVSCVLQLDNNAFAAGTDASYFWVCNAATKAATQIPLDGPVESDIGGCILDRSNLLWYVPQDPSNGIGCFNGSTWTKITTASNPSLSYLASGGGPAGTKNCIVATTKNDIWVTSYAGGLKWFDRDNSAWSSYIDPKSPYYTLPSPLARYDSDSTLWWTLISGACEDSLGYIWVANYLPYTGSILNARKPRENTWRTFSFGDTTYNFLSRYAGPVVANRDHANQREVIYLGYLHNEALVGGGLSVLSYYSSPSADPMTAPITCISTNDQHIVSVNDIAVANDTLVWLACGDGIYKMTNNDPNSITKVSQITSTDGLFAVTVGYGGRAVFCKDRDLFSYADGDSAPMRLTTTGNLGTPVNRILLDKKNNVYWVASHKGLFRFDTGDSTAVVGGGAIDVYPNPVSCMRLKSGHVVRFSGVDPANPTVRIFDAGGALVRSISEINTRIVAWNGANQSGTVIVPGIYFYQASSGKGKNAKGKIFVIP